MKTIASSLLFLVACQPTCPACDPPGIGLELAGGPAGTKAPLPLGAYEVTVDTGRLLLSCGFVLTDQACADGAPTCVVDSTCTDLVAFGLDLGTVVPIFDVSMAWPEVDDVDEQLAVTVALDGAVVGEEVIPLVWSRQQRDEVKDGELPCWCSVADVEPLVVIPAL